jgi:hypothetical protein
MAKEYKRTEKTQKALDALVALGGSATFAEIKAYLKEQGETLGTANLGALKREGLVETQTVEVERVTVDKVNKYVLTDTDAEDAEDTE